jgi:hypothetical protein
LLLIGRFFLNLLWNHLAKWTEQKLILPLARFTKKKIKMWIPTCNV